MSLIKATIDNNYNYNVLSNDIKYYLENKQLFRGIIMKEDIEPPEISKLLERTIFDICSNEIPYRNKSFSLISIAII